MAQHDFEIDNQTAPAFRTDLNNALEALATLSSGATAPTTTYPNMLWYDSANNILKMRTEADDAWIDIGTLNQSTNTFEVANLTELTQGQAEDDADTTFGLVSGERLSQAVAANAPSSGLVPLATATASSDATIEFTSFDSTKYDSYVFVLSNVLPATSGTTLRLRTSEDGGSTFDSGGGDYSWVSVQDITLNQSGGADSEIQIAENIQNSGYGVSGEISINRPDISAHTGLYGQGVIAEPFNATEGFRFAAQRQSTSELNAVQFFYSSGNIASGTITMYGRLKV